MNFYFDAAKTLDRLDAKQGSIKGVLATLPEKDRKRTAALVIETLKYKSALAEVITTSKLLKDEKKITSMNLALVLVHDVLLSKNGIQAGDGPVKQAILRHKTRLNGEFQKLKIKRGARTNADLAQTGDPKAALIPRYVRVNTSLWSLDEAIVSLTSTKKGFHLDEVHDPNDLKSFAKDAHVPNLLLFHPTTQFTEDDDYKSGRLILQDKSSCFPAVVLNPLSTTSGDNDGPVVIDATAAPGNKTSHLSALMGNKGKLYAFERDKRRFETLKMMLRKAQCKNVETVNADFLTVDPADTKYANVTHILLDPSCSGSGIVNRLDHLLEPNNEEEESENNNDDRLQKLASFQLMMIRHAMKFPKVQKIVYSTCSIHATENEHVVRQVLQTDEAIQAHFLLAPPDLVLPTWPRRGIPGEMTQPEDAASVIRCMPSEDATNGFFVSCFIRKTEDNNAGISRARQTNTTTATMKTKSKTDIRQQRKTAIPALVHATSLSDKQNQNERVGNKRKAERNVPKDLDGQAKGEGGSTGGGDDVISDGDEGASRQEKKRRKGKRKKSVHDADNTAS